MSYSDNSHGCVRYLRGSEFQENEELMTSMFRDRNFQFKISQNRDVNDDLEKDQYDAIDPLYMIHQKADGSHGGSIRFLATTGRTMVQEMFPDLLLGRDIRSPHIWECTRFCLSRGTSRATSAILLIAAAELMKLNSVTHTIGVIDQRMFLIYRWLGASPEILGSKGEGKDKISAGLWSHAAQSWDKTRRKACIDEKTSREWVMNDEVSARSLMIA